MPRSQETRDQLRNLIDAVFELQDKVRALESDIYDMKQDNAELSRRVSNLEPKKRMPPFSL